MWPKALPDALPSYDVLVLETDWWHRFRLLAVNTGCSSLGLLARNVYEVFDDFLKFVWNLYYFKFCS